MKVKNIETQISLGTLYDLITQHLVAISAISDSEDIENIQLGNLGVDHLAIVPLKFTVKEVEIIRHDG